MTAEAPLWRAAQVFRLATLLYALGYQVTAVDNYDRPTLSWFVVALMAVWSGLAAVALSRGGPHRTGWVIADQLAVVTAVAATRLVAEPDWYASHQSLPTTLWATNAVLSAAILGGPLPGMLSGLAIAVVTVVVRGSLTVDVVGDATGVVLVCVGLAVGMAANTARRSHDRLERAARLAAATEERERLGRQVHDGVLQVLAYVSRRGTEIGGPTAELAMLAGEQEVALRELISTQAVSASGSVEEVDLRVTLRAVAGPAVSLSGPADPVRMPGERAAELAAVVREVLANTTRHAGAGTKSYVLLEDLGDDVIVSVRDDGVGIEPGRLVAAQSEGRMGVSRSILGRVAELGGTATLDTASGQGVEWEIRVGKRPPGKGTR